MEESDAGFIGVQVSQLTESIDTTRASHLEHADEALNQVRSDILKSLADDMKNGGSEEVRTWLLRSCIEVLLGAWTELVMQCNTQTVHEKIRQGIMLILERFGPNSVVRAINDLLRTSPPL